MARSQEPLPVPREQSRRPGLQGSADITSVSLTQLCLRQAGRAFPEWLGLVCLDPEKAGCKQGQMLGFSYLKIDTVVIYINVY